MSHQVRQQPCEFCPYREDVPSGVWAENEYDKLPPYDKPTWDQPMAPFMCHATPDFYCHGWAVTHSNRGHEYELLALRMEHFGGEIPPAAVPLFESGQDAAFHGKADITAPTEEAVYAVTKLTEKYPRLEHHNADRDEDAEHCARCGHWDDEHILEDDVAYCEPCRFIGNPDHHFKPERHAEKAARTE